MTTTNESEHLAAVQDRLSATLPEVSRHDIEQTVAAEYARFEGRSVRDFVPLFVERNAREALRGERFRSDRGDHQQLCPVGGGVLAEVGEQGVEEDVGHRGRS